MFMVQAWVWYPAKRDPLTGRGGQGSVIESLTSLPCPGVRVYRCINQGRSGQAPNLVVAQVQKLIPNPPSADVLAGWLVGQIRLIGGSGLGCFVSWVVFFGWMCLPGRYILCTAVKAGWSDVRRSTVDVYKHVKCRQGQGSQVPRPPVAAGLVRPQPIGRPACAAAGPGSGFLQTICRV
ncbi:hypothetical protein BO70DRAFT_57458 [Aspergillus heteromorphus CBS 117.55]|uniref:Uncharacterized protein n=1 Tax=Aspergillus heteromorphus CBS 117.55 TaxID=1448321 RepID=A0A317VY99_9EURO|nr:uncharacterized protein BO70DRAFT_57458 [Aspergillus heteromorphus CBS 117.55]PWY79253.1 hypothetical protein BO70DRAFT_57458 [Aspergillus heteromorphus CBS 117.55]